MSAEEMREYCLALFTHKIRVELRLKNVRQAMFGRIVKVDTERFDFVDEHDTPQAVRFAWVARLKSA